MPDAATTARLAFGPTQRCWLAVTNVPNALATTRPPAPGAADRQRPEVL